MEKHMNFECLLVEDGESFVKIVTQLFSKVDDANLTIAKNYEEAVERVRNGFYHLSLIDLHLKGRPGLRSGFTLMQRLLKDQPASIRIAFSRYISAQPKDAEVDENILQELVDPLQKIIDGAIDKADRGNRLEETIEQISRRWHEIRVNCIFPQEPTADFARKLNKATECDETAVLSELVYLVSVLCNTPLTGRLDVDRQNMSAGGIVQEIKFELLRGGASTALVLAGQPTIAGRKSNVWLVMKFDQREKITDEVNAFHRYVKMQVSRKRRVDLLGHCLGSRLGVICYTFAGNNPSSVILLRDLVVKDPQKAGKVIENIFKTKDLHDIPSGQGSLKEYFNLRFKERDRPKLGIRSAIETLDSCANASATVSWDGQALSTKDGRKWTLDSTILAEAEFDRKVPWTIIHGDLHGGNIIRGNRNEGVMIDFRDTGPGPTLLDYCICDISVRSVLHSLLPIDKLWDTLTIERSLWRLAWKGIPESIDPNSILERATPAQKISYRIMLYAKDKNGDALAQEYASTAFAWNIHLLSLSGIPSNWRPVLSIWSLFLASVFREE